jgi:hypothetical protein
MSTLPRHLKPQVPTPEQVAMMELEELRKLNTILDVGLTEICDLLERLNGSIQAIALKQK